MVDYYVVRKDRHHGQPVCSENISGGRDVFPLSILIGQIYILSVYILRIGLQINIILETSFGLNYKFYICISKYMPFLILNFHISKYVGDKHR
jgi:hypothetical protein